MRSGMRDVESGSRRSPPSCQVTYLSGDFDKNSAIDIAAGGGRGHELGVLVMEPQFR